MYCRLELGFKSVWSVYYLFECLHSFLVLALAQKMVDSLTQLLWFLLDDGVKEWKLRQEGLLHTGHHLDEAIVYPSTGRLSVFTPALDAS